jgi:hypothetical protein
MSLSPLTVDLVRPVPTGERLQVETSAAIAATPAVAEIAAGRSRVSGEAG